MQAAPIQFSHANGFPARSYDYFFRQLQPHPVSFVPVIGAGKYQVKNNWYPLVNELITHIETHHQQAVIGLGHSMGGVLTLWAAIERPDLFKQIVLMDPPLFDWKRRFFMRLMRALRLSGKVVPVARMAKRRRAHFDSREQAFEYWQQKPLFREFHPQCYEDYVNYGLTRDYQHGGFTLTIPSQLEYKLFVTTPGRIGSTDLAMPSHYIFATRGNFDHQRIIGEHKPRFHKTTFLPFEGRHMFPLEHPEEVGNLIKSLIVD